MIGLERAQYPEKASQEGVEAAVTVELEISASGVVTAVDVVSVEPDTARGYGFERAAIKALFKQTFQPARRGDEPIPVRIGFTYRFVLEDPSRVTDSGRSREGPNVEKGTSEIKGQVLELGTRDPLVGARVVVFEKGTQGGAQSFEAWTDTEGRFVFRALPAGSWAVLVESEEHFPVRTLERISTRETLDLVLRIERRSYNMFDVLIEEDQETQRVMRRVIPMEEIERMPGIYGDPLKVLQALPGVAQTNLITSDVIIRGGAPEDTAFYALGLEVPAVFHFGGIRGIFPGQMVDRVSMIPGDFPVYYGRSIGGVVDVIPPKDTGEHIHGTLDVSLLDTTLSLEVPVSDTLWVAVAGRRSYIDAVVGGVNLVFNEQVVFPRYNDVHLQVGWRPDASHDLRFFFFSADDDFIAYGPSSDTSADEDDLPKTSLVQLGIRHVWYSPDRDTTWESVIGFGWSEISTFGSVFGSLGTALGNFETRNTRWMGRSHITTRITPRIRFQSGLEAVWNEGELRTERDLFALYEDYSPIDGDLPPDLPPEIGFDFNNHTSQSFSEVALWTDLELALADTGLTAIPGVRVERYGQIEQVVLDPRLRLEWVLSNDWTVRGAVGLMHQPPQNIELETIYTPMSGSTHLDAERAFQTSLSVETSALPWLVADMSIYLKTLDNLVTFERTYPPRYTNAGRGRTYGAEWLLRIPLKRAFNGWIAYTLSRSERLNPRTQEYDVFAFDQTHNLTVFAAYKLPRDWSVSGRFRYASGFPLFSGLGFEEVLGRSLDFIQGDVRIDKLWVFNNWTLNAYFDLQNVTNRINLLSGASNSVDSESVPPPGVPILPILGVNTKF